MQKYKKTNATRDAPLRKTPWEAPVCVYSLSLFLVALSLSLSLSFSVPLSSCSFPFSNLCSNAVKFHPRYKSNVCRARGLCGLDKKHRGRRGQRAELKVRECVQLSEGERVFPAELRLSTAQSTSQEGSRKTERDSEGTVWENTQHSTLTRPNLFHSWEHIVLGWFSLLASRIGGGGWYYLAVDCGPQAMHLMGSCYSLPTARLDLFRGKPESATSNLFRTCLSMYAITTALAARHWKNKRSGAICSVAVGRHICFFLWRRAAWFRNNGLFCGSMVPSQVHTLEKERRKCRTPRLIRKQALHSLCFSGSRVKSIGELLSTSSYD